MPTRSPTPGTFSETLGLTPPMNSVPHRGQTVASNETCSEQPLQGQLGGPCSITAVAVGTGENCAAIGCETCHGRIDTMEVVHQVQPLSMSWCLECHSNPAQNLRPVADITKMGWTADMAWQEKQRQIAATLNPPGSLSRAQRFEDGHLKTYATAGCSGCHR